MFSSRTPRDLAPNRISEEIARLRRDGRPLIDLTESNPTRAGIEYPREAITAALASGDALRYEPDPLGLASARSAVAAYYAARGADVASENIVLTASTSEAYSLLFKVLADANEAILFPRPSYPLFEHLARIEAVDSIPYSLAFDGAWRYDAENIERAITPRCRAVVVVSPNNPTGSALTFDELAWIEDVCERHRLVLICDEVFADYLTPGTRRLSATAAGRRRALTLVLNGLSKIAGLPQLKLGWISVSGPSDLESEALARLEFAADLFLSVGTPVQQALPALLALAAVIRDRIRTRVGENRDWLVDRIDDASACSLFRADGGWYAVVRVPRVVSEEDLVLALIREEGVLVQPGYFFDFEQDGLLVLSLLPEREVFRTGADRVLRAVERFSAR